jgi:hypothetical protein
MAAEPETAGPAEEPETTRPTAGERSARNGSNGSEGGSRKAVVQTAALAVAASAAALAARRMFLEQSQPRTDDDRDSGARSEESLLGSMLVSGWCAAQDSLLPVAEDAASAAGEFVARSAPDVVSERLLPRFISGFERGRKRGD